MFICVNLVTTGPVTVEMFAHCAFMADRYLSNHAIHELPRLFSLFISRSQLFVVPARPDQ